MDVAGGLFALLVLGFMLFVCVLIGRAIARSVAETRANRAAPLERRDVRVVAKRTEVSGGSGNSAAFTAYYATFEDEDGLRQEFPVPGKDYDLMAEGDRGTLSRQGTWFKGFARVAARREL